jgi:uncharacterized membrane protein YdfJ with MMPL/SSD domain
MLARLGGMIYRTRWLVLVLALLIVAGAAAFGTGLFGSLKSGGFNDPASESSRAQALLDSKLGGATADIVILMSNNSIKATSCSSWTISTGYSRDSRSTVPARYICNTRCKGVIDSARSTHSF